MSILTLQYRLAQRCVLAESGCLEWQGAADKNGYGQIGFGGHAKKISTHRAAWMLVFGEIPDGLNVLHHCDNPPCCQTDPTEGFPDGHLFLGTHADNMQDKHAKGRGWQDLRMSCPQDHAYDAANTIVEQGRRKCRKCRQIRRNKGVPNVNLDAQVSTSDF